MANEIGSLVVRVGSDVSGLLQGIKKSESALEKMGRVGVNVGLRFVQTIAAATAAVAAMAFAGVKMGDEMAEAADKIGLTAGQLSIFRYAAKFAGVEAAQLDGAMIKLGDSVSEAAHGNAEMRETLEELGLTAEELRRLPLDEQMLAVGDAMQGVANQTDKLRIASDLFGRGAGAEMVAMFENGTEALRTQMEEAKKYGLYLDQTQTRVVSEAADAQDRMKGAFQGLSMQLGATFGPAIELVTGTIANLISRVTESLPKLAAMAEGFLGIQRAVNDLSDADLSAQLLHNVNAVTELEERIAGFKEGDANARFTSGEGLVAMERELADLMERQRDLLRERVERTREAEQAAKDAATALTEGGSEDTTESEIERLNRINDARLRQIEAIDAVERREEEFYRAESERQTTWLLELEAAREAAAQRDIEYAQQQNEWQLSLIEARTALARQEETILQEIRREGAEAELRFAMMTADRKAKHVLSSLSQMTAGVAQHSKAMFNLNKAAALAHAAVTLPAAVLESFRNNGGFPWGAVAAGAMAAAGAAQIAAIKNTQFGGGGSGTTPSVAGSTPTANGQPVQQQQAQQIITVRGVNADQLFTGRQLVETLNSAVKDGARLVFEQ